MTTDPAPRSRVEGLLEEGRRLLAAVEGMTPFAGYLVKDDGLVWSLLPWRGKVGRPLAGFQNTHGYLRVKVNIGNKRKTIMVHKVVCEAFHGPKPSPAHQVRHLNGIKTDNRPSNLAWGTAKENAADRTAHGRDTARSMGLANKGRLRGIAVYCQRGHVRENPKWCTTCRREWYRAARK